MRFCAATIAMTFLCAAMVACGDAPKSLDPIHRTTVPSPSTSDFSTHGNDRDNDGDHNDDDGHVLYYGQAARPATRRTIVALVMRYFAAAAADDGAEACTLLAPLLAESVVENNGKSPGLRGSTCAVVMSKLFGQHHLTLVAKSAALRVIDVRVENKKALVVLDFPEIPEVRQIVAREIGGEWRVFGLLDGIIE